MRVYERGAGETLSSGSGSSAAAVAAVVAGRVASPVTVRLDGGTLRIDVADDLAVKLTGPVEQILTARFEADFLRTLEALP
jgi:diaminopimelate epimerase